MKTKLVSVVFAMVFAVAGVFAVMPASSAHASGYAYLCGNSYWQNWVSSGYVYTYRYSNSNQFCSVAINPWWGQVRYPTLWVAAPGQPTRYDVGVRYYGGPLYYTLSTGQCATVTGQVNGASNVVVSVCNPGY